MLGYFEAYEKIIGRELNSTNATFSYYHDFVPLSEGATEGKGRQQMQEAMHIFDVLGLPEQVAYYQEHFDKFVIDECS